MISTTRLFVLALIAWFGSFGIAASTDGEIFAQAQSRLIFAATGELVVLNPGDDPAVSEMHFVVRTSKCDIEVSFTPHYLLPQAGQNLGKRVTVIGYFLSAQAIKRPCKSTLVATDISPAN